MTRKPPDIPASIAKRALGGTIADIGQLTHKDKEMTSAEKIIREQDKGWVR